MNVLYDTHLLIWTAISPEKLPLAARQSLAQEDTRHLFSSISVWEAAIKRNLGRDDFEIDPNAFRAGLRATGFTEVPMDSRHGIAAGGLPLHHRDPFDRLLIAQARTEGLQLMTSDRTLAVYGDPVRVV